MKKIIFFSVVGIFSPLMLAAPCCGKKKTPPVMQIDKPVLTTLHQPSNIRVAQHPIDKQFIERRSPRAMAAVEMVDEEILKLLMPLFEAARWAPSSFNEQPWHFLYVTRNDPHWQDFLTILVPFNQSWAKNALVLVVMCSRNLFEKDGSPNTTHSFDAGAAWAQFALQGHLMGLAVHGMAGFDYQRAREELRIPDCYTIEAMAAVGKLGDPHDLPEELRAKELYSDRKKVDEFITRGPYLSC